MSLVPVEKKPEWLAQLAADVSANDQFLPYSGGVGSRLPRLSLRGKVFRIKVDGEEIPLTDPNTGAALPFLPVVMVAARPGKSKAYYKTQYQSGQEPTNPDCWSFDGVHPDPRVENPVAPACSACPMNQFGSRATMGGGKGKACQDYKMVVVAIARADGSSLADVSGHKVFALKVPPASLKALADYTRRLTQLGAPLNAVVTKFSFDPSAEFPRLQFEPMGYVNAEVFEEVQELALLDEVVAETSLSSAHTEAELDVSDLPAPEPAPAPAPEPEETPKRKRGRPRKKPKEEPVVEATPEPEPAPAPEPEPEPSDAPSLDDPNALINDIIAKHQLNI